MNGSSSSTPQQTEALLSGARVLAAARQFDAAVDQLEAVIRSDPAHEQAREDLQGIHDLLINDPRAQEIEDLLSQAKNALESGDAAEAERIISSLLGIDREHQEALCLLETAHRLLESEPETPLEDVQSRVLPARHDPDRHAPLLKRIDAILALEPSETHAPEPEPLPALPVTPPEPPPPLPVTPLEPPPPPPPPPPLDAGALEATDEVRRLIDAKELDKASELLAATRASYPQHRHLVDLADDLERIQQRVLQLSNEATELYKNRQYGLARARLDALLQHTREDPVMAQLRSMIEDTEAGEALERETAQLVTRLDDALNQGHYVTARELLAAADQELLGSPEVAPLKARVDAALAERERVKELLERAHALFEARSPSKANYVLDEVLGLEPDNSEAKTLQDLIRSSPLPSIEPLQPPRRSALLRIVWTVVALALVGSSGYMGWRLLTEPASRGTTVPPPPPGTGTLEVTLTRPGRVMLDGFQTPDGGGSVSLTHRFSGLEPRSYEVTAWPQHDSSEMVKRRVTVRSGKTIPLEIQVTW